MCAFVSQEGILGECVIEQMDKCAVTTEEERPLSLGGTGFSKVHTVESRGYAKSVVSVTWLCLPHIVGHSLT